MTLQFDVLPFTQSEINPQCTASATIDSTGQYGHFFNRLKRHASENAVTQGKSSVPRSPCSAFEDYHHHRRVLFCRLVFRHRARKDRMLSVLRMQEDFDLDKSVQVSKSNIKRGKQLVRLGSIRSSSPRIIFLSFSIFASALPPLISPNHLNGGRLLIPKLMLNLGVKHVLKSRWIVSEVRPS